MWKICGKKKIVSVDPVSAALKRQSPYEMVDRLTLEEEEQRMRQEKIEAQNGICYANIKLCEEFEFLFRV